METLQIALVLLVVLLLLSFFYFYQRNQTKRSEGFTTIAVDAVSSPKCFARSPDAQRLLSLVRGSLQSLPPSSDPTMAYEELQLILQKALCMDADITGMGRGPYTTYALPYNTQHDIEPVANFVGRCMTGGVRSRDIGILFDKMQVRGVALLEQLCAKGSKQEAIDLLHKVLSSSERSIANSCLREQPNLDIPPGVRDAGYYMPPELTRLSSYQEEGR